MSGSLVLKELKRRRLPLVLGLFVAVAWIPAALLLAPGPLEDPLAWYAALCLRPLLVLGCAAAAALFAAVLRGDWTRGTAEFLLAKPWSRTSFFLGKALAGLAVIAAPNAAAYLSGMASLTFLCEREWSVGAFLALSLDAFLPMSVFAGAALLASLLLPGTRSIKTPAVALTLACFLPDALTWADGAGVPAAAGLLAPLRWAGLEAACAGPTLARTAVPAALAVALFAASLAVFRRKDVPEREAP